MAKIKLAGKGKKKKKRNLEALPCLILIVLGIVLLGLLFYAILQSAGS